MTLKNKYDLGFYITIKQNGKREPECFARFGTGYGEVAQTLNHIKIAECRDLINEIELAQNGKQFEEYFSTDFYNTSLEILPPNFVIDKTITLPLDDMKLLLLEWIEFSSSR